MKFCSLCGAPVEQRTPAGDNRQRYVCTGCGAVHYQNPRNVVGCVVEDAGKILLCRRSIEPRAGYWTVPAGFLELGETLSAGAARETREEACAEVDLGSLFAVVNIVHAGQVHLFFEATFRTPGFAAGEETLEAMLVSIDELPWQELAFPSVRIALECYLQNREDGVNRLHITEAPRISDL